MLYADRGSERLNLVPEGGYECDLVLKLHSAGSKGKTLGLFLLELFFAEAKKSGNTAKKNADIAYILQ